MRPSGSSDLLMYCDDCSLIRENIDLVNEEFRDYVRSELFDTQDL